MADIVAQPFGSLELHGKMGHRGETFEMSGVGKQNMPRRYESEEEDISESEISGRDEHLFSPVDMDSDCGAFDSDCPLDDGGDGVGYVDHARAETPSPRRVVERSRPTSMATIKASSGCIIMPSQANQPASEQETSLVSSSISSLPSSRLSTILVPTEVSDSEALSYHQSFYIDLLSSDDEGGADKVSLIATSVTYRVPTARPSLVSIAPPLVPRGEPGESRKTKKQKKQEAAPISRQVSTKSSRSNSSAKSRISRLGLGRDFKNRSSSFPPPPSTNPALPSHSNQVVPPPSPPPKGPKKRLMGLSSQPDLKLLGQWSMNKSWTLLPTSKPRNHNVLDERRASHGVGIRGFVAQHIHTENESIKRTAQPGAGRSDRRRIRGDEIPPIPRLPGRIPSSLRPRTALEVASMEDDQQHFYPSTADTEISPSLWPTRTDSARHRSLTSNVSEAIPHCSDLAFNELPAHSKKPVHDSARSIRSMASGKSKHHFPTFDAASVKSMSNRYYRRIYSTEVSPSCDQPPSPSSSGSGGKFHNRYSARGSVSTTNLSLLSSSTSEFGNAMPNSPGEENDPKRPDTSYRKHLRSKSIKRIYETSESVSRVSSKAFTGLGHMLRKATSQDNGSGLSSTDF